MTDILTTARALLANCTGEGKLDWWASKNDGSINCGPAGTDTLEVGYTDMNDGDNALVLAAPTLVRQLVEEYERLTKSTEFTVESRTRLLDDAARVAQDCINATAERDVYRAMVCDLLASAHPHPVEHPTMAAQWARARELLKNGPVKP